MNIFIGCVKEKLSKKAKARDLYTSDLFKKELGYALSLKPDNIYILSAKHHIIDLDEEIAPYDVTLNDFDADQKREWAEKVLEKAKEKKIDLNEKSVFLAGKNYYENLLEHFPKAVTPYDGLEGIGYIMQWLDEHTPRKYKLHNMITTKLMKLAKLILALEETETNKANLIHEGKLEVGSEVFIEDENGELLPAGDGEYETESQIIVVAEGKVAEIRDKETQEPEPEPEPEPESLDEEQEARIAELEAEVEAKNAEIEAKDARIAELEAELEDLKAKLEESDARSAEEELKMNKQNQPKSKIKFDLFK